MIEFELLQHLYVFNFFKHPVFTYRVAQKPGTRMIAEVVRVSDILAQRPQRKHM